LLKFSIGRDVPTLYIQANQLARSPLLY